MAENNIFNVGTKEDGVLYNSYLIKGKKNVLIDTLPQKFCGILSENILKICGNEKIDYIVLNHTEEDRSGCLKQLLKDYPDATVVATVSGLKNIFEQLNCEFNQLLAKSNMVLEIDEENSLKFLITHNINWPDSMMTYHINSKSLFSCDAFSDIGGMYEYYEKNLSPFSEYVYSASKLIKELEIENIYQGNGEKITNPKNVIDEYLKWSKPTEKTDKNVCIIYYSKTGHTKRLVESSLNIADNLIKCIAFDALNTPKEKILDAIYNCDGVVFATPTHNRNIPIELSQILMSVDHFRLNNQIFACFGSYGWSGEAPNLVYSYLRARHFDTYSAPFRWLFDADGETLESFNKYIKSFYEKVINI